MKKSASNIKILILSAPIGSGHRLAAEALKEYLESFPGVVVEHGNVFSFFPKLLGDAFLKTYLKILAYCPWLYAFAYRWGNEKEGSLWLRSMINRILAFLGKSYIFAQNPDAVIATHATPAGILSHMKLKNSFWFGCVITDYTVHRWWVVDNVDTYFVAAPELKSFFSESQDVQPLGIPVREKYRHLDRGGCRKQLKWSDDEKVCLMLGGGEGLLPMEEILCTLEKVWPSKLRMVAVTGNNTLLRRRLEDNFKALKNEGKLDVLGFRDDLPQLMAGADIVISKAGGLSTAELLVSGVDFVLYKPLPGQEANNAKFLKENYGVSLAQSAQELKEILENFLKNSEIKKNKFNYGKPLATREIGNYILKKTNYCLK